MKLYGSLASPYVARVVMFADLKGIQLPLEAAPGGMGSAEYKAINVTGKIPALQTDRGCIAESSVICDYLEAIHPEPRMLPEDPMLQAHTRMIDRMTDLYVAPHNTPLTRMRRSGRRDPAVIEQGIEAFARAFNYVGASMGPGPFAAGDQPSLGDCALAPFILMLQQTVFNHFPEIGDPTAGGRIGVWWQALQSHAGCKRNLDAYDVALREFLQWLDQRLASQSKAPG